MTAAPHAGAARPPFLVYPLLVTVTWGAGLLVGAVLAMVSVMMYDAPGSEDVVWTHLCVAGFVGFPVLCLASIALAWPAWFVARGWDAARSRARRLLWGAIAALPLLPLALAAVGFGGLALFCGGSFACKG